MNIAVFVEAEGSYTVGTTDLVQQLTTVETGNLGDQRHIPEEIQFQFLTLENDRVRTTMQCALVGAFVVPSAQIVIEVNFIHSHTGCMDIIDDVQIVIIRLGIFSTQELFVFVLNLETIIPDLLRRYIHFLALQHIAGGIRQGVAVVSVLKEGIVVDEARGTVTQGLAGIPEGNLIGKDLSQTFPGILVKLIHGLIVQIRLRQAEHGHTTSHRTQKKGRAEDDGDEFGEYRVFHLCSSFHLVALTPDNF